MYAVSVSKKHFSWTYSAWDPTEPIATRPLFTTGSGNRKFFYTCDGNKNVSELVHFETRNGIAAHYDNYLCVQKVDALNNNSQINLFVWDPTEP